VRSPEPCRGRSRDAGLWPASCLLAGGLCLVGSGNAEREVTKCGPSKQEEHEYPEGKRIREGYDGTGQ